MLVEEWRVFSEEEIEGFNPIPDVTFTTSRCSAKSVVEVLQDPYHWELQDEEGEKTTIKMFHQNNNNTKRIYTKQFLRTVTTKVGPLLCVLELWSTLWVEGENVVHMHSYDAKGKVNLVSKFICRENEDDTTTITFEERTEYPKTAVKILNSKIKKSHQKVLETVVEQAVQNESCLLSSSESNTLNLSHSSSANNTPRSTELDTQNIVQIERIEEEDEWAFTARKSAENTSRKLTLTKNAFDL